MLLKQIYFSLDSFSTIVMVAKYLAAVRKIMLFIVWFNEKKLFPINNLFVVFYPDKDPEEVFNLGNVLGTFLYFIVRHFK